jgi:hypothetical protein
MKKGIGLLMIVFALTACGNQSGQTGVDNDGIKTIDSNGGLADTVNRTNNAATDSSKGEHRVDISNRDTLKKQ